MPSTHSPDGDSAGARHIARGQQARPRGALPSPGHRLPGDRHLPRPRRRIALRRRRPHRRRHPHPTLRLGAEPGEAVTAPSLCNSLIGFKQVRLLTRCHLVEYQLPRFLQAPDDPRHRRTVQIGAPNLQRSVRRDLRCRQKVCADEALRQPSTNSTLPSDSPAILRASHGAGRRRSRPT